MNHISTIALCAVLACSPCVAQDEAPAAPANPAGQQHRNAEQPSGGTPRVPPSQQATVGRGILRRNADPIIAALQQECGSSFKVWWTEESSGGSPGQRREGVINASGDFNSQPGLLDRLQMKALAMIEAANPTRVALNESIDFDFPGGTAEEFLAALLPSNLPINIVYDIPAAKRTPMPALKVKQLTRKSILDLMQDLGSQSQRNSSEGRFWHSWRLSSGGSVDGLETMLVRRENYDGPSSGETSPRSGVDNSADLEPAVLRIPPADATSDEARKAQEREQQLIISAIDDGIQLRGGPRSTFKIKLNPATGILFVQGNYAEKKLVTTIVNAMKPEALVAAPPPAPATTGTNRPATQR